MEYSFYYKKITCIDGVMKLLNNDYFEKKKAAKKLTGTFVTSRLRCMQFIQLAQLTKLNAEERQKIMYIACNMIRKCKVRYEEGGKDYLMYLASLMIQDDHEWIDIKKRSDWIDQMSFKSSCNILVLSDVKLLKLFKIDIIDALEQHVVGFKSYRRSEKLLGELDQLVDLHGKSFQEKLKITKEKYPICYEILTGDKKNGRKKNYKNRSKNTKS